MNNTRIKKTSWVYTPKKITVWRGIGFGLTDLMGGGWNNIVSGVIFVFVMSQGISPALAGAITGIGRIFDALFSLFFGGITDNFYRTKLGKKFGRRHFWIFVGGILFMCIFPLFWVSTTNWLYYLVIYVLVELAVAMILIPWETLPTEMTSNYNQRTTLSGSRMVISATGTFIVFLVLAILQSTNNRNAYLITGIIWTIVFVIAIFTSWRCTWERPLTGDFLKNLESQPKMSLGETLKQSVKDYGSTFRNKSYRKHLAIYLLSFTGRDFYATLMPTFILVCINGSAKNTPWTLNALSVVGIFATLYAARLMITHGPKFLYKTAYLMIVLAMILYISIALAHDQIQFNSFWLLVLVTLVYQCGRALLEFTPWNVFPFIPDVDRIMTHRDRAGIYAAVMTFFRKSTGALASWSAGILLSLIKYNSKTMTTFASTPIGIRHGILIIFFLGPVILILSALYASSKFKLNKQTHKILQKEIQRLENGGSKDDVDSNTKKVVEELTGHPYAEMWPDLADKSN